MRTIQLHPLSVLAGAGVSVLAVVAMGFQEVDPPIVEVNELLRALGGVAEPRPDDLRAESRELAMSLLSEGLERRTAADEHALRFIGRYQLLPDGASGAYLWDTATGTSWLLTGKDSGARSWGVIYGKGPGFVRLSPYPGDPVEEASQMVGTMVNDQVRRGVPQKR